MDKEFKSILKTATKAAKQRGYDMFIIANNNVNQFSFTQDREIYLDEGETIILKVLPDGSIQSYIRK